MKQVKYGVAAALVALALLALRLAMGIPIEAGGLLFGPMLLGLSALCVFGALAVVEPRRPRPKAGQPQQPSAAMSMIAVVGLVALVVRHVL